MRTRGSVLVGKGLKLWLAAVALVLATAIVSALFLPRSFGLTAATDIVQCLLLISGTAAFIPAAIRSHGRLRLFWSLVAAGVGLWLGYQLFWTYYELVLRRDVPDLCAWDIVLFLHFVPLMAGLTRIGLRTRVDRPGAEIPRAFTAYGVWIARCSMIAVFSLPVFAAWSIADVQVPGPIRTFRLVLTLLAAFCLGIMVFVRQQLLDRELVRLLNQSRTAFDNLKRLQAQILQSEKLASIGQLVGGAAHELNNPITAMLGYSDLLLNTPLTPDQRPSAEKIGLYVRRTRSLVASLISFARQTPLPKSLVDLNTLARTAIKLAQPQWEGLRVEMRPNFDPELPKVIGDSNQLLQVCLQLLANCLHVLTERGGRILTISTHAHAGICVLQIATEKLPSTDTAPRDAENNLALSACQGILQEHRGQLCRESSADGSVH